MKNLIKKSLLVLTISALGLTGISKAQSMELLAGNTLNGAMNGVVLGASSMALQNSTKFSPIRVGLGFGTLYGIGMGVHDMTRTPKGQQFYISGFFNDGTNTSIIVLLDTFYGAGAGAVISTSYTLIAKEPIVNGLQYGTAVGSWLGFGFGVFDAFILSGGPESSSVASGYRSSEGAVEGLVTFSGKSNKTNIGLLSPSFIQHIHVDRNDVYIKSSLTLDVVNLSINL